MMKEKVSIKEAFISFIKGVSSFGGGYRPRSPYEGLKPEDADADALRSDWEAVGNDIRSATRKFQESITPTPPKNSL